MSEQPLDSICCSNRLQTLPIAAQQRRSAQFTMTQVLWFEPHLGRPPHITALTGLSTMGGGSEGSTVLLQGSCLVELEGRSGDGCNLQSKPTKVIPGYGSCCYLFFRFRLNSNHTFKEENTSVSLIFPY